MWPFTALARRRPRVELGITHGGFGGGWGMGGELSRSSWGLGGLLPGSDIDWAREVRDPSLNATIHACLRWIVDNITEADWCICRRAANGEETQLQGHPLLDLLERPNPEYDGESLFQAAAIDYALYGNAYLIKERSNRGEVLALWWKPAHEIAPRWPQDGSAFIKDYLYRPSGRGAGIPLDRKDVIHVRWGLDTGNEGRTGKHRSFPILREVAVLNESSTYTAAMSKMGVPTFAFTPKDPTTHIGEEARNHLREWWANMTTRDQRGKPLVPSLPMEFNKLGLSPEEMALDKLPHRPAMLVCAAFGIHPAVVNLATDPKGLDNGGQQEQARKQSYHDCLVPMRKRFGIALTTSLLNEYEQGPIRSPRLYVSTDFSRVQALGEDVDQRNLRVREDYKAGLLDRAEARAETGRKPRPEDVGVYSMGAAPESMPEEPEPEPGQDEDDKE